MFERFTREARQALQVATAEAHRRRDDAVDPEHLLFALISSEAEFARRTLAALTVDLDYLRRGTSPMEWPSEEVCSGTVNGFTRTTKNVLELSLREAAALHPGRHVGTDDLLFAIVRHGDNTGARVLTEAGVELDELRRVVLDLSPPTSSHGPNR